MPEPADAPPMWGEDARHAILSGTAPKDVLRVTGDLKIAHMDLSGVEWPDRLVLVGTASLSVTDCSGVNVLPRRLEMEAGRGSVFVSRCGDLEFGGEDGPLQEMVGGAVLRISHCPRVRSIPSAAFNVDRCVSLTALSGLSFLPKDAQCKSLYLRSLPGLSALPPGLHVEDTLACREMESLRTLDGANLAAPKCITVMNCPTFEGLSRSGPVELGGDLRILRCEGLHALSGGLKVSGEAVVFGCRSITEIGDGVNVQGKDAADGQGLAVMECPSLERIGSGLRVVGDFAVAGCPQLASIGPSLCVSGDMAVNECDALGQLGTGMSVSGWLAVNGRSALTDARVEEAGSIAGGVYWDGEPSDGLVASP